MDWIRDDQGNILSEVESTSQPSQPNPELQKLEDAMDAINLELNRLAASSEFEFYFGVMLERVENGLRIFDNDDSDGTVITNPQDFIDALKAIAEPINWDAETPEESNADEVFDAIWTAVQNNS